jgi:hypothetical protein
MDYFKIITIIFMIVVSYKIFLMDSTINENFEATPTIVDDWNAINQLAQISKQLMKGGLTIPGALSGPGWKFDSEGNLTVKSITCNTLGTFYGSGVTISTENVNPLKIKTPGGNEGKILMVGGGKAARIVLDGNGDIYNINRNNAYLF